MLRSRLATAADVRLYFDWANDPHTRQQSFRSEAIPFETHAAWFARKITDPNALLLLFEDDASAPVGQVRFERSAAETIIGVSLDTAFRGKGLAPVLLQEAIRICRETWGNVLIHAYIKPENQASIRAFERAGFVFSHESDKFGVPSLVYTDPA